MFQALHQNPERLVQSHPSREKMRKLLSEKVKMRMSQSLRRPARNRSALWTRLCSRRRTGDSRINRFDLDRDPALRLNLRDRTSPIIAGQNPIDQLPIRLTRLETKLRHDAMGPVQKSGGKPLRLAPTKYVQTKYYERRRRRLTKAPIERSIRLDGSGTAATGVAVLTTPSGEGAAFVLWSRSPDEPVSPSENPISVAGVPGAFHCQFAAELEIVSNRVDNASVLPS